MKKILLVLIFLIFITTVQSLFNYYYWQKIHTPQIHTLDRPLVIDSGESADGELYTLLPRGTVLYNDSDSLNQRVAVYFNLEGMGLKFTDQDPDILKQPSHLYPIRRNDISISRVLKYAKLTKREIYYIIKYDDDLTDIERAALYKFYKVNPTLYKDEHKNS